MMVTSIKTRIVTSGSCTLTDLLDESITDLPERSVVAVASKVVAVCEGRTVPREGTDKDALVAQDAQFYLPSSTNRYNVALSITRNILVAAAGVDESNGNGEYILWPADPQADANTIRKYLRQKFGLKELGVIITDSATRPFQWGTTGIAIAYSGFEPLHDYRGQKDLFGRRLEYQTNNIQNGLAAAAAMVMGEGSEQTPLAILEELDFVAFVDHDPTEEELAHLRIEPEDDLYAPLLQGVPWRKGRAKSASNP
jgi:dihydrofolate synthase / folylpolyglutamate synthase